MTEAGTSGRGGASAWRLLTAVLALYALVLTSMLGTLAGLLAPAHGEVICQVQDESAPADPQPGKACQHAACCTVASVAAAVEPPSASATAIVWPPRRVTRLVWRMDGDAAARAPPGTIASPRAPPVA